MNAKFEIFGYVRQIHIIISLILHKSPDAQDKNNSNLQLFSSMPYNLRLGVNETEMTGKVAL